MITKQDFEIYLDYMLSYYGVERSELRLSAYKVQGEDSYEFFDSARIISILESGIMVWKYEEDEEEENESVFVSWSAIDEISIMLRENDEDNEYEE